MKSQPPKRDAAGEKAGVLLVYGVGDPKSGSIRGAALEELCRRGMNAEHIREVNWNAVVEHPGDEPDLKTDNDERRAHEGLLVGTRYLARLSRAVLDVAILPIAPPAGAGEGSPFRRAGRVAWLIFLVCGPPVALVLLALSVWSVPTFWGRATRVGLLAAGGVFLALATVVLVMLTRDCPRTSGVIRALLLSFGWPFVFPVFAIANLRFQLLVVPAVATAVGVIVSLVPRDALFQVKAIDGVPWHEVTGLHILLVSLWGFLVIVVGPAIAYGLQRLVRRGWILIKVVADVALYLGRVDYRTRLIEQVDVALAGLLATPCGHVVFVTHSLGTVIAVDALRRGLSLPAGTRLTLFTSGSPLRRLISHFFAALYDRPADLLAGFRARYEDFEWVNVYRPKDPIGGSLCLPAPRDACTKQTHSVLRAHQSYWNDPVAYDCAIGALEAAASPGPPTGGTAPVEAAMRRPSGQAGDPVSFRAADTGWLRNAASHAVAGAIVAAAVWLALLGSVVPVARAPGQLAALAARGADSPALVRRYYRDRVTGDDNEPIKIDTVVDVVKGDDPEGAYPWSIPTLFNDEEAVVEAIRARYAGDASAGRAGKSTDARKRYQVLPVTIRFLPEDPSTFTIRGYERAEPPRYAVVGALAELLILAPALLTAASALWTFVVWPVVVPLIGATAEVAWARFGVATARRALASEYAFWIFTGLGGVVLLLLAVASATM